MFFQHISFLHLAFLTPPHGVSILSNNFTQIFPLQNISTVNWLISTVGSQSKRGIYLLQITCNTRLSSLHNVSTRLPIILLIVSKVHFWAYLQLARSIFIPASAEHYNTYRILPSIYILSAVLFISDSVCSSSGSGSGSSCSSINFNWFHWSI